MRRRAGRGTLRLPSLSALRGALATAAYANDNQIDSRKYIVGASMTRAFVITSFVRRRYLGQRCVACNRPFDKGLSTEAPLWIKGLCGHPQNMSHISLPLPSP